MITADNYFNFVFSMVLSFGLAFELPVVVLLLTAAGLVTPQLLTKYRRHAAVLIIVLSAFLTPGDYATSMIAMAVPLYLLYEISVIIAYVMWRKGSVSGSNSVAVLLAPLIYLSGRRSIQGRIGDFVTAVIPSPARERSVVHS